MKSFFNALFLGTVLMAPKYALIPILFGCIAAWGEQHGVAPATNISVAVIGVLLGIIAVFYNVHEEAEARKK